MSSGGGTDYPTQACSTLAATFDRTLKQQEVAVTALTAVLGQPARTEGSLELAGSKKLGDVERPIKRLEAHDLKAGDACDKYPQSEDAERKYQNCKEAFALNKILDDVSGEHDKPDRGDNCLEGTGNTTVTGVTYGYCSVPCSFKDADCVACPFAYTDALGSKTEAQVVCSSEVGAKDAISGFCADKTGITECKTNGACRTAQGKTFTEAIRVVEGSTAQTKSIKLSAYLGAKGTIEVSAGVQASASVSVKGTVEGAVKIEESGAAAGTANGNVQCVIEVNRMLNLAADGEIGAGFDAVFVKGKAVVMAGAAIDLSKTYTKKSPVFPRSGLPDKMVFDQCFSFIAAWVANDLRSLVKGAEGFDVIKTAAENLAASQRKGTCNYQGTCNHKYNGWCLRCSTTTGYGSNANNVLDQDCYAPNYVDAITTGCQNSVPSGYSYQSTSNPFTDFCFRRGDGRVACSRR